MSKPQEEKAKRNDKATETFVKNTRVFLRRIKEAQTKVRKC